MIPIRAATTAQQVHDWLYRCVLRGDLLPGTRLSETEIAAQVNTLRATGATLSIMRTDLT